MFHIAVVEDDNNAAEILQSCLQRFSAENHLKIQVNRFSDGVELLEAYRGNFDVIFMDIVMPNLDGMSTAQELRQFDAVAELIFVTNMANMAISGYGVDAADFVLKPIHYASFSLKLKKIFSRLERKRAESSIVISLPGGDILRVPVNSLLYVEVVGHRLIYHTDSGSYTVRQSMKQFEKSIPAGLLLKCNSCYMVNPNFIKKIDGYSMTVGNDTLTISHGKRTAFMQELANYYVAKTSFDRGGER